MVHQGGAQSPALSLSGGVVSESADDSRLAQSFKNDHATFLPVLPFHSYTASIPDGHELCKVRENALVQRACRPRVMVNLHDVLEATRALRRRGPVSLAEDNRAEASVLWIGEISPLRYE